MRRDKLGNVPSLSRQWLQCQVLAHEISGASRTLVVSENGRVIGFYALATGSVRRRDAPGKIKRGMPDPIPVTALGRLAVDLHWQNKGFGPVLLKDAVFRTVAVAKQADIRALIVHALSDKAREFYLHYGFQESPPQSYDPASGSHELPMMAS